MLPWFLAFTSHETVTNTSLKLTMTLGHARHYVMLTKYKHYPRDFAVNQNNEYQLTLTRLVDGCSNKVYQP